jgi:hypothetical protein
MQSNLIGRTVHFTNTLLVRANAGQCRIPVRFSGKICGLVIGGEKDDFGPILIIERCEKIQRCELINENDGEKTLMTAWISEINYIEPLIN